MSNKKISANSAKKASSKKATTSNAVAKNSVLTLEDLQKNLTDKKVSNEIEAYLKRRDAYLDEINMDFDEKNISTLNTSQSLSYSEVLWGVNSSTPLESTKVKPEDIEAAMAEFESKISKLQQVNLQTAGDKPAKPRTAVKNAANAEPVIASPKIYQQGKKIARRNPAADLLAQQGQALAEQREVDLSQLTQRSPERLKQLSQLVQESQQEDDYEFKTQVSESMWLRQKAEHRKKAKLATNSPVAKPLASSSAGETQSNTRLQEVAPPETKAEANSAGTKVDLASADSQVALEAKDSVSTSTALTLEEILEQSQADNNPQAKQIQEYLQRREQFLAEFEHEYEDPDEEQGFGISASQMLWGLDHQANSANPSKSTTPATEANSPLTAQVAQVEAHQASTVATSKSEQEPEVLTSVLSQEDIEFVKQKLASGEFTEVSHTPEPTTSKKEQIEVAGLQLLAQLQQAEAADYASLVSEADLAWLEQHLPADVLQANDSLLEQVAQVVAEQASAEAIQGYRYFFLPPVAQFQHINSLAQTEQNITSDPLYQKSEQLLSLMNKRMKEANRLTSKPLLQASLQKLASVAQYLEAVAQQTDPDYLLNNPEAVIRENREQRPTARQAEQQLTKLHNFFAVSDEIRLDPDLALQDLTQPSYLDYQLPLTNQVSDSEHTALFAESFNQALAGDLHAMADAVQMLLLGVQCKQDVVKAFLLCTETSQKILPSSVPYAELRFVGIVKYMLERHEDHYLILGAEAQTSNQARGRLVSTLAELAEQGVPFALFTLAYLQLTAPEVLNQAWLVEARLQAGKPSLPEFKHILVAFQQLAQQVAVLPNFNYSRLLPSESNKLNRKSRQDLLADFSLFAHEYLSSLALYLLAESRKILANLIALMQQDLAEIDGINLDLLNTANYNFTAEKADEAPEFSVLAEAKSNSTQSEFAKFVALFQNTDSTTKALATSVANLSMNNYLIHTELSLETLLLQARPGMQTKSALHEQLTKLQALVANVPDTETKLSLLQRIYGFYAKDLFGRNQYGLANGSLAYYYYEQLRDYQQESAVLAYLFESLASNPDEQETAGILADFQVLASQYQLADANLFLAQAQLTESYGLEQDRYQALNYLNMAQRSASYSSFVLGLDLLNVSEPLLPELISYAYPAGQQRITPLQFFARGVIALFQATKPELANKDNFSQAKVSFVDHWLNAYSEANPLLALCLALSYKHGIAGCEVDNAQAGYFFNQAKEHANWFITLAPQQKLTAEQEDLIDDFKILVERYQRGTKPITAMGLINMIKSLDLAYFKAFVVKASTVNLTKTN